MADAGDALYNCLALSTIRESLSTVCCLNQQKESKKVFEWQHLQRVTSQIGQRSVIPNSAVPSVIVAEARTQLQGLPNQIETPNRTLSRSRGRRRNGNLSLSRDFDTMCISSHPLPEPIGLLLDDKAVSWPSSMQFTPHMLADLLSIVVLCLSPDCSIDQTAKNATPKQLPGFSGSTSCLA